jgi:hypothetical protein
MTNQQHPITPPPELVQQWASMSPKNDAVQQNWIEIATQAARWGADQELEACCEVLHQHDHAYLLPSQLRTARRPKPPSLKEQALGDLDGLMSGLDGAGQYSNCAERIRRALENLND